MNRSNLEGNRQRGKEGKSVPALVSLPLLGALLLCGCLYPGYKKVDLTVCELAAQPYDIAPPLFKAPVLGTSTSDKPSNGSPKPAGERHGVSMPVQAADTDIRTAALLQGADKSPSETELEKRLKMPSAIPGAETPLIVLPKGEAEKREYLRRLYPELPPLQAEPAALPGPNGCPLTLDDLQREAAANSPTLREAAAAVVTAEGNMQQAGMYPNPTFAYENQPNNNNATAGAVGFSLDQVIKTGGKLKLAQGAAQVDVENAKLDLKRARSDLATQVRNAYFALLVSRETVRVNKALAEFTDTVYRISEETLEKAGQVASYEPAALRAQAHAIRLAYKQALQNYLYNWEQLRAAIGLCQMPLTQVAGRIDACIPYYDYNAVLCYVLQHHTDVKKAHNGIEKAKLNLKLAQVTPLPDPDVHFSVWKEATVTPFTWFYNVTVGVPVPIWDCNKGAILAAQGSLISAQEEPHRVELALTTTLASAYAGYKNNLLALEDYRKLILPDQIRVYRGILDRRRIDLTGVAFSDLVTAQQAVAASVATYLTTLGALWSSVVSVADLLQTCDLFQLAEPLGVMPIPDLLGGPLPCAHPCAHGGSPALPDPSHPGAVNGPPPAGALPGNSLPSLRQPTAPSGDGQLHDERLPYPRRHSRPPTDASSGQPATAVPGPSVPSQGSPPAVKSPETLSVNSGRSSPLPLLLEPPPLVGSTAHRDALPDLWRQPNPTTDASFGQSPLPATGR